MSGIGEHLHETDREMLEALYGPFHSTDAEPDCDTCPFRNKPDVCEEVSEAGDCATLGDRITDDVAKEWGNQKGGVAYERVRTNLTE